MSKLIAEAVLAILAIGLASAADSLGSPASALVKADLDKLVGQPVDIAPWTYAWRADRAIQEKPEACFIPRRIERMDKIYRTAFHDIPKQELKSWHYEMPDLLQPLPPKPKGNLQAALLWTGALAQYCVELHWPADAQNVPAPEAVEVRAFPTPFGWFGWSVDEILGSAEVSADRRTWTYKHHPATEIPAHENKDGKDWYRSGSATELIAVFHEEPKTSDGAKAAVPCMHVTSPSIGAWKRMDMEIEWSFQPGTDKTDFDGRVESYLSILGPVAPLADDKQTVATSAHAWHSRAAGDLRRAVTVPLLYASGGRPGLESRVTIWTKTSGFTVRVRDLENGPILVPEHGLFVTKAGGAKTARQFAAELAARNLKSLRQLTREHPEPASWEELMRKVRLSTCPAGTVLPPLPKVPDPPMQVQLSDPRWTDAWRVASFQLKGKHMWGGLAFEVGRVAHEMDLVGLHDEADKVYQYFLKAPGAKPDGDYADGTGALEWARDMRHDMGYNHDGTHASTGRLLFGMADRYFLTGDKAWFQRHRERMQAAADWIIRQRNLYMKNVPNRQDLLVAGLMPPAMLGDYALPSCDWRWYYVDNALSLQGLQRFADALAEFDAAAGRKYRDEAEAFRRDIRRAVDRDAALSPVRLGRDGAYHSFFSAVPYVGGELLAMEFGSFQRPQGDVIMGALPLAEPFAAIDASDPRMMATLNAMDEVGTSPKIAEYIMPPNIGRTMNVRDEIAASVKAGPPADDAWFWRPYGAGLPKASHNANIYLLEDDVPGFLRFWMNSYAAMVGADGKFWEWGHLGEYGNCSAPDNGTAGWFLENFRNLLVMEEGDSLWIARATPRAWLEQGKKIAVQNAPTCFGSLAYEIVSDVDHAKIAATIEIPSRRTPRTVLVRFRHPKAAPIKSATVNGQPWNDFDAAKEVIRLRGAQGAVRVEAIY